MRRPRLPRTREGARRWFLAAFAAYGLTAGAAADGDAPYALTLLLAAGALANGAAWLATTDEKEDEQ